MVEISVNLKDLMPDISSIKDETQVIITILMWCSKYKDPRNSSYLHRGKLWK
jgi:hypothetical protein